MQSIAPKDNKATTISFSNSLCKALRLRHNKVTAISFSNSLCKALRRLACTLSVIVLLQCTLQCNMSHSQINNIEKKEKENTMLLGVLYREA